MRQDLIKQIAAEKDVTNAIVLTHNIDFVFLQSVVMAAFRRCGNPTLTVFVDAQCGAESFVRQRTVIGNLGIRYRVVPVAMRRGFRFHPKAVFLSGRDKGTLFIGSGNLTFGGWRENAEIWVRFDTDAGDADVFGAFKSYLARVVDRVPLRHAIDLELAEAFDGATRDWARELGDSAGLLGTAGDGPCLLDRIRGDLDPREFETLIVCSPYFDPELAAISEMELDLRASRTRVLIQERFSDIDTGMAERLPEGAELVATGYQMDPGGEAEREAFIHAKFYALSNPDSVAVLVGSANCSRAALTLGNGNGNAELMARLELGVHDFQEVVQGELRLDSSPPDLRPPADLSEVEGDSLGSGFRILAASYELDVLTVALDGSPGIHLVRCLVDEERVDFEVLDDGLLVARPGPSPRTVVVEGELNGSTIRTSPGWIDHERELRAMGPTQALGNAAAAGTQSDEWSLGSWNQIIAHFCRHLAYIPKRTAIPQEKRIPREPDDGAQHFTARDVFVDTYSALPGKYVVGGT